MTLQGNLDYLTIRGFQSIRHLERLHLHALNVLIGANGAGKSNLIGYFRMLSELVEGRLQVWTKLRGGSDRLLTYGTKTTSSLDSLLEFGANRYQFSLRPKADGSFVFDQERIGFDGTLGVQWTDLGSGYAESRLKQSEMSTAAYCYEAIANWKVFHFHDTSDTDGVKQRGFLHDNTDLHTDASNLAAYLYRLRQDQPETYSQIRKIVQLAIPFFDDFVLRPEPPEAAPSSQQIQLAWRQKNSDYNLWPDQLSDGSIRFICLTTALLRPEVPATIIIDEPELGLHPHAITLLGSLMQASASRTQIIVSTQSVPLLNQFSISDLIVVERQEAVSVFKRLVESDFQSWLAEYSVGELWEKNILGGRP